jgi:chromate transporter
MVTGSGEFLRPRGGPASEHKMPRREPCDAVPRPTFREALRFWFKLGWISFGGTAAHIAIMHDELVQKKRWISNGKFLHALSHCMVLPGPEAQQLAIYIGWKLHGKRGGVVAGTLFVLPSMFVLLTLSMIYVKFGNLPWIAGMFNGLKAAVIALVVIALHRVAKRALRGAVQSGVAAAAFAGMFFFDVSLLLVMLGAIVLGTALGTFWPSLLQRPGDAPAQEDEGGYYIGPDSVTPEPAPLLRPAAKLTSIVLFLWLLPLLAFYFFVEDFRFWNNLVLFFTKTAFVTIGGSYTVIPYVARIAVSKLHWLNSSQMTDGFALAETTPGPLIIVVAFVGFMAGYNHFHGSLWMGTLGLLATTFYTFLPCFLFVFAGAPLVERTQGRPAIQGALGLITAVVVGASLT